MVEEVRSEINVSASGTEGQDQTIGAGVAEDRDRSEDTMKTFEGCSCTTPKKTVSRKRIVIEKEDSEGESPGSWKAGGHLCGEEG